MNWFYILFAAVIVEGLISYFNMIVKDKKIHYEVVISGILGIVIAYTYNVDIFEVVKIETSIPYIGTILTGILISRGSNYIYDLLNKIVSTKDKSLNLETRYERPKNEINEDIVNHEV